MPALVDHAPADGGPSISVFESGAIMMYLAENAGRFYPQDIRRRYEVNQWVIWRMANQGPKLGECGRLLRLGNKQGDRARPTGSGGRGRSHDFTLDRAPKGQGDAG